MIKKQRISSALQWVLHDIDETEIPQDVIEQSHFSERINYLYSIRSQYAASVVNGTPSNCCGTLAWIVGAERLIEAKTDFERVGNRARPTFLEPLHLKQYLGKYPLSSHPCIPPDSATFVFVRDSLAHCGLALGKNYNEVQQLFHQADTGKSWECMPLAVTLQHYQERHDKVSIRHIHARKLAM